MIAIYGKTFNKDNTVHAQELFDYMEQKKMKYVVEKKFFQLMREDLKLNIKAEVFESFDEVKADFGKTVDRYGKYLIFDIGGNKDRLSAVPQYNTGRWYVRHVLTPAASDLEKWPA